jgi:hypothetical protein
MIPITPISELTQPAAFTAVEYPVFAQSCGGGGQCLTDGWATFAVMAHAILDQVGARARAGLRVRLRVCLSFSVPACLSVSLSVARSLCPSGCLCSHGLLLFSMTQTTTSIHF